MRGTVLRSVVVDARRLVLAMSLAALAAAFALTVLPRAAQAEPLLLDPAAAAECPDCATPEGGAQVINYFQQLAPQSDITLTPPDGVTAPPGGWQASAESMVAEEAAMDAATGAAGEAADAVASTTVLVEEGAAAIPELCSTAILCPAALAVGAFGTGYVIGTGAKALYLRFFGGEDPNTESYISSVTWNRLTWSEDYHIASDAGPVVHPGEYYLSWAEENPFGYNFFSYAWHGAVSGNMCRFGIVQPRSVIVRYGTTPYRCSSSPPQPIEAYIRTPEMFIGHHRPPAPASTTDTTGSTTVPAPPTPSRSDFGDAATDVLNDPSSTKLRLWLEHQLAPRCHADPTKDLVNVPNVLDGESEAHFEACLTSLGLSPTPVELPDAVLDAGMEDPVWSNPGDDATVEPDTTIKVYVNPPNSRAKTRPDERCRPDDSPTPGDPGVAPPGYSGPDPRFEPRPAPAPAGYPGYDVLYDTPRTIRLWWGTRYWGYRHIETKRGYGPTDEANTLEALQDPVPLPADEDDDSSWIFQSFYDVIDALTGQPVHCARSVLVNFFQRGIDPDPRDIITSFYGSYQS
ncbi:PASTA domain-containing protein [Baekduia sp. Peel2402]|uniref:PASTA domain-containing protein n=1 Tax=Baekduia sp. Peel2402 TaxID=3458296 RepID=UPI00403EDE9A